MALSNRATPRYYRAFRDAVARGEIPICKEISMEMDRIASLIRNPGVYYDDEAVEGFIRFCTLTEAIILPNGDTVTWRLCEADVARNRSIKYFIFEEFLNFGENL